MQNYQKIFNDFVDQFQANKNLYYEETLDLWYRNYFGRDSYKWELTSKGHDFINSALFKLTQLHGVDVSKETLTNYFIENRHWVDHKIKYGGWYWRYKLRHTKATKYRRDPSHKKKELTDHEIHKREWRKRKERDRRKTYWKNRKRYLKEESKIRNRMQTKQLIYNGLEDMIISYNRLSDPWIWD